MEQVEKTGKTAAQTVKSKWHAIMVNEGHLPILLSCDTQRDLKRAVQDHKEYDLVHVIKGKEFRFEVQKSFSFLKGSE